MRQLIAQDAVQGAREQAMADLMDRIPDAEYDRRLDRENAGQSLGGRTPASPELVGRR
jgi:hypothetical protein